jgi:hypothetical protein
MIAVWMCLPTAKEGEKALRDVRRLLTPNGYFFAGVTHPCFRTSRFRTYETDFDGRNYLTNGARFNVRIFDSHRECRVVDTHWNLSEMSRQLMASGFFIARIYEIADIGGERRKKRAIGCPWLVLECRPYAQG